MWIRRLHRSVDCPFSSKCLSDAISDRLYRSANSRSRVPFVATSRGNLFAGVWCGACKFGHLDLVRYDRVLSKMVGWDMGAGHRSYQCYLNKFTQAIKPRGIRGISTSGSSTILYSTTTHWISTPL